MASSKGKRSLAKVADERSPPPTLARDEGLVWKEGRLFRRREEGKVAAIEKAMRGE
jgi:hypothetical protein